MSLANIAARSRRAPTTEQSLPAPIAGWNARDGLDAMQPVDAVMMENHFPSTDAVVLRSGFTEHAYSLFATVETLASYHDGANVKMLAAANGNIWNVTSAGAAVSLASGFSANRWQYVNFNGSMGLVNGTDAPQTFDGTSIAAMTVSGSGLTVADLIGIAAFRNRTYFWTDDSQDFWYSAVNSLGGVLTKFQLSRVGQFGGKLVNVVPWTIGGAAAPDEAGVSLQQVLCFVMSSGDIIVYRGSDPGDATDWALVGVYRSGAPIDIRGAINLAGDAVMLTKDGAVPMSAIMQQGRFSPNNAITDRIRKAFNTAAREYSGNTGWQAVFYPNGPWYLVNVPISTTQSHQYVMNTITGAWCKFTGMNARSWTVYGDALYFGTPNGKVYKADDGLFDTDIENWDEEAVPWEQWTETWGSTSETQIDIDGETRQAFSNLGTPRIKQVTAARPIITGGGDLSVGLAIEADFGERGPNPNETSLSADFQAWNDISETWDANDDNWNAGSGTAITQWLARSAKGTKLNVRLVTSGREAVTWYSTDIRFTVGSGL